MRKILRIALVVLLLLIVLGALAFWWLSRPDVARFSQAELSGRVPVMASQRPESVPTLGVAKAVGWPANGAPVAAPGLTVARFAEGLDHPRAIYVLPNGDVLVAETNRPAAAPKGIVDRIAARIMDRAGAGAPTANRITLLRDADGDGRAEVKSAYITRGLNSPYGMVLVGNRLFVANTDGLMAFDYVAGATTMADPGKLVAKLPAHGSNSHWTKPLAAAPDGSRLFVGVGSQSNIAEGGLAADAGRARILEVRLSDYRVRDYATGLRNPSGLGIAPNGDLWAVVNERDQLGSDLVPDYFTRVDFGDFFGWPWYYWGGYVDPRVTEPDANNMRQYVRRPNYGLGAHVAPLGFDFAGLDALGGRFGPGAFVALHGSWNRVPAAGYSVVFVPFGPTDMPTNALPTPVLRGFLAKDGETVFGRPADVRVARDGALLVADDSGNMIWRISAAAKPPAASTDTGTDQSSSHAD